MIVEFFLVISVWGRYQSLEHVRVPMPTIEVCMEYRDAAHRNSKGSVFGIECKSEVRMAK